jgi:hypothetical protein
VLIANDSDKVEFSHASEHLACNIRTARVVAEVLGEQFVVPVRSREARLDRYLRYGEIPDPSISLVFDAQKAPCTSRFLYSWTKIPLRNQEGPVLASGAANPYCD